ncbi:hypothetical protein [Pseudomonas sp. CC120222-01a]|nr:hypothetical protein [Pseudomonas sp. CC120222-01a]
MAKIAQVMCALIRSVSINASSATLQPYASLADSVANARRLREVE